MLKNIKKNRSAFVFSLLLIASQLIVIAINCVTNSYPWASEDFHSKPVYEGAIILLMYFALGICGICGTIVCMICDLKKDAETKKEDNRQRVKKLTMCAVMLALYIAVQSAAIDITSYVRITFNYLVTATVGMLYGPYTGAVFGIACDLLGYMVHPGVGGFFPAYTLIAAMKGALYGSMLYRGRLSTLDSPPSNFRIVLTKAIDTLFCNLLCMTWVNSFLYKLDFFVILPARALKNIVMLPIEAVLLCVLLKTVFKVNKESRLKL